VVSLIIIIAGLQAVRSLNVRQYPKLEAASIVVTTVYVGASRGAGAGLRHYTPGAGHRRRRRNRLHRIAERASLSTISVRLRLNFDGAKALADVSTRVNQVRADLPPSRRYRPSACSHPTPRLPPCT